MEASEVRRAVKAGRATASALGFPVDDVVVMHNSDRIVLRLIPCGVLARVAPSAHQAGSEFEVEVARRLAGTGGPVAELEPRAGSRVYLWDGFAISLWTYYEPAGSQIAPADYAGALMRLHAALRQADLEAPHFTDRVAGAQKEVGDPERTPALPGPDRELLSSTLSRLSSSISRAGAAEQLLHGEPHPGNLLSTSLPGGPDAPGGLPVLASSHTDGDGGVEADVLDVVDGGADDDVPVDGPVLEGAGEEVDVDGDVPVDGEVPVDGDEGGVLGDLYVAGEEGAFAG
jgi:hypothetical protein